MLVAGWEEVASNFLSSELHLYVNALTFWLVQTQAVPDLTNLLHKDKTNYFFACTPDGRTLPGMYGTLMFIMFFLSKRVLQGCRTNG